MKMGDIVYGIRQGHLVDGGIEKGMLERTLTGYTDYTAAEGRPCYELYMGPEDRTKSTSIFDFRIFEIKQVFATFEEANKFYFTEKLAGRLK